MSSVTEPERREEYAVLLRGLLEQKNVWLVLISRAPVPGCPTEAV